MYNSTLKYLLLLYIFFAGYWTCAQDESESAKIYAVLINQEISVLDSMYNKQSKQVFVTTADNFTPTTDIRYLQDYLNGNIEKNEIYKEAFAGEDPLLFFDMPPTFGLSKLLKEDEEVGRMMVALFKKSRNKHAGIPSLNSNYTIKYIKNAKPYFNMGWDKFHSKYPDCYGIINLSEIVFSDSGDRAIIFTESFRGSLDGEGNFVIMRKLNDQWVIEYLINQWIS